jgi:hypothetical protein
VLFKAVCGAVTLLRGGLGWLVIAGVCARWLRGRGIGGVFPGFGRVPPGFPGFLPGSLGFPPGSPGFRFFGELFCFQILLGFVWKKLVFPEFRYSLCCLERRAGDSGSACFQADLVEDLEGRLGFASVAAGGFDLSGSEDAFVHDLHHFSFKAEEV